MSQEIVADILANLAHSGVKGMRWGVRRKATVGPQEVIIRDSRGPGHRLKTSGGAGHPAAAEAVRSREIGQISRKSGLKALSNKDLEEYNRRLNLEQNAKRLRYEDAPVARKFVLKMLGQSGKSSVQKGLDAGTTAAGKKALKLAMAAAA
jgi:hypothetical protein